MPSQKQRNLIIFPIFPDFPDFGFFGKKSRGNRIICEKPGRYVITPYYIDTLAKKE